MVHTVQRARSRRDLGRKLAGALLLVACNKPELPHIPPVSLAQLEAVYGPLISAGNEPTPDQHGTGDRIGLFRDRAGTVWGLPLNITEQGAVQGCAPAAGLDAPVTDTLPDSTRDIVGAMNSPTGWRGGTGRLELLLRTTTGELRLRSIQGAVAPGPVCWAYQVPGVQRQLHYYRLAPAATSP